jgi:ribonucleotide monophosphatase NagD (HAD superfamily)
VAFVATNPDAYDVVAEHRMPGNGCFVAAVSCVAGRGPDAVCGKPAAALAEYLVSEYALQPARTCMVGDRLDTDIALAHAMGASSLLVLTGVASADDVVHELAAAGEGRACGAPLPTHAISHVGRLLELEREQA